MFDALDYEELAAQVNTKFRLTDAPETIELELIEVTPRVVTPAQEMFSLIFRGAKDFVLSQKTYQFTHEQLGAGALFIVPVGQDAAGICYEAAFNRLLPSTVETGQI